MYPSFLHSELVGTLPLPPVQPHALKSPLKKPKIPNVHSSVIRGMGKDLPVLAERESAYCPLEWSWRLQRSQLSMGHGINKLREPLRWTPKPGQVNKLHWAMH